MGEMGLAWRRPHTQSAVPQQSNVAGVCMPAGSAPPWLQASPATPSPSAAAAPEVEAAQAGQAAVVQRGLQAGGALHVDVEGEVGALQGGQLEQHLHRGGGRVQRG